MRRTVTQGGATHGGATQGGAAMIVALLAVAMATLLATRLVERTDATLGYIDGRNLHAQAVELTRGGVDYARAVLFEDQRRTVTDHTSEPWATPLPPVEASAGHLTARLSGRIEDQQGHFNLNNLRNTAGALDTAALTVFRRLLGQLSLDVRLADRLGQHLVANGPLGELAALADVPDVDAATIARLQPYVAALPGTQALNVNTAPAPVLMAALPQLDAGTAQQLVARRESLPFRDLADFRGAVSSRLLDSDLTIPMDIRSRFFLVRVDATIGRAAVRQEALLDREATARWPRVLWRHDQ